MFICHERGVKLKNIRVEPMTSQILVRPLVGSYIDMLISGLDRPKNPGTNFFQRELNSFNFLQTFRYAKKSVGTTHSRIAHPGVERTNPEAIAPPPVDATSF